MSTVPEQPKGDIYSDPELRKYFIDFLISKGMRSTVEAVNAAVEFDKASNATTLNSEEIRDIYRSNILVMKELYNRDPDSERLVSSGLNKFLRSKEIKKIEPDSDAFSTLRYIAIKIEQFILTESWNEFLKERDEKSKIEEKSRGSNPEVTENVKAVTNNWSKKIQERMDDVDRKIKLRDFEESPQKNKFLTTFNLSIKDRHEKDLEILEKLKKSVDEVNSKNEPIVRSDLLDLKNAFNDAIKERGFSFNKNKIWKDMEAQVETLDKEIKKLDEIVKGPEKPNASKPK